MSASPTHNAINTTTRPLTCHLWVNAQVLAAGQAQGQDGGPALPALGQVLGPVLNQLLQLRQHLQASEVELEFRQDSG